MEVVQRLAVFNPLRTPSVHCTMRANVGPVWGGTSPNCRFRYCVVKIAFGIMPWMPLVPSTT